MWHAYVLKWCRIMHAHVSLSMYTVSVPQEFEHQHILSYVSVYPRGVDVKFIEHSAEHKVYDLDSQLIFF